HTAASGEPAVVAAAVALAAPAAMVVANGSGWRLSSGVVVQWWCRRWEMVDGSGGGVGVIDSSGWSFVFAVLGQMTYLVASLTLDSANSCVMQGVSCTQRKVSMVLFSTPFVLSWGDSISSDSFLPSILLLVVIIVTVVIVVVILIVVVVAIVGVVIVVFGGVSSITKFSFMIIGLLCRIMVYYLIHQPLGYGNSFL
nr:hypothetical protein [Tanacetum cinerariifolium]